MRPRTYRAHGRINSYMTILPHQDLPCGEGADLDRGGVEMPEKKKVSKKQLKKQNVAASCCAEGSLKITRVFGTRDLIKTWNFLCF
jgi:hypothetical protein